MATITKHLLSGSTDGKQIKVAATATPGTAIHTAHATALDEVWLWADNDDVADILLTIEWGGVTDVDNTIKKTIKGRGNPGQDGKVLVVACELLTNSLLIKAFAGTTNKIKLSGYVNRITS